MLGKNLLKRNGFCGFERCGSAKWNYKTTNLKIIINAFLGMIVLDKNGFILTAVIFGNLTPLMILTFFHGHLTSMCIPSQRNFLNMPTTVVNIQRHPDF